MGYAILVAIALLTFLLSSLWWLSGWQGGSSGEAGPIGTTIFFVITAAGILYAMGMLP